MPGKFSLGLAVQYKPPIKSAVTLQNSAVTINTIEMIHFQLGCYPIREDRKAVALFLGLLPALELYPGAGSCPFSSEDM